MTATLAAPSLDSREWLMALRVQMLTLGRTNRHIARQLGFSDPAMSRVMNGATPLTPELRAKLLLALHSDTFDAAPDVVRRAYPSALAATGD